MPRIYLDNAATSFPKPPQVAGAVFDYMTNGGCNINRGGYQTAYDTEEQVFETRQLLCELFDGPDCKNVIFTKNVTESLNLLIKGFLHPGDHVLVSAMEHNAVMRPLVQMTAHGVEFSRIPCRADGSLCIEAMEGLICPNTRAVILTHASNVCGTVMPIRQVGEICRRHRLRFFVDAAQTAGVLPISMTEDFIDAVAFTGHKGLLGPQGTGGLVLTEGLEQELDPLLSGGTGSLSHTEEIPAFLPDRFEPGTLNLPGILGLRQGLLWLGRQPEGAVLAHELALTGRFLAGLASLEGAGLVRLAGKRSLEGRTGVVSIQTPRHEMAEVAYRLDSEFGIQTRVGLHCAPSAHKSLGTWPAGTIRFSFGAFSTEADVDAALAALEVIVHGA